MIYINYYSKIQNTTDTGADIEKMKQKELNKIVTKTVETADRRHGFYRKKLFYKASDLASRSRSIPTNKAALYTEFRIPKRSGGYRILDAPNYELKELQREILNFLSKDCKTLPHNAAHAFVKNRNCKTAMQVHQRNNSRWFLKLDIKDFFNNCDEKKLKAKLKHIYPLTFFTTRQISLIVNACTLAHRLPQGAPTSPILSNLYMLDFDHMLTKQLGTDYVYTRYADDILISSRVKFHYTNIVNIVAAYLTDEGMNLNHTKTRFGSSNGSNWNLGIMYNKDLDITVGYRNKHLIKNKIHNLFTNIPEENTPEFGVWLSSVRSLQGTLAYYKHIEPEYFNNLLQKYRDKGYNV